MTILLSARNILIGLTLTFPIVAYFASKGVTALLFTAVALLACVKDVRAAVTPKNWMWAVAVFGPLLAWGTLTSFWAIDTGYSALVGLRLAAILLAFLILSSAVDLLTVADRLKLRQAVAIAGLILLGLIAVDLMTDLAVLGWVKNLKRGPGTNDYLTFINSGISMLALFAGLFFYCLQQWKGYPTALLIFGLALIAVWRGNAMTPLLALLAVIAGFVLALAFGRGVLRLIYLSLAGYVLTMPLLLKHLIVGQIDLLREDVRFWSLLHRLEIWNFGFARLQEKPLFGWGFDASRNIPGGNASIPNVFEAEYMPLHPHNSALQVWLELGLVGAVCFAVAVVLAGRMIESQQAKGRMEVAVAAGMLAGFCVQAQISYGTWQNWWLSSVVLAAVLYRGVVKA